MAVEPRCWRLSTSRCSHPRTASHPGRCRQTTAQRAKAVCPPARSRHGHLSLRLGSRRRQPLSFRRAALSECQIAADTLGMHRSRCGPACHCVFCRQGTTPTKYRAATTALDHISMWFLLSDVDRVARHARDTTGSATHSRRTLIRMRSVATGMMSRLAKEIVARAQRLVLWMCGFFRWTVLE